MQRFSTCQFLVISLTVSFKQQIFDLIVADTHITRRELADTIGINQSAIQKHIDKLKGTRIRRVGGDNGGHWEIIVPEG